MILAFDTATPDTVVGLSADDGLGDLREARHTPQPGERPGHASQLLVLAERLLAEAGAGWAEVSRIGAGVGPGTFTGLRIGIATARALAQAAPRAHLVAVSTLEALALGADPDPSRPVLACVDARRGEAYVAAWATPGERLLAPAAVAPGRLAVLLVTGPRWWAVGDGSVAFRAVLEAAGAHVPDDGSALHHVGARALCRLAAVGTPVTRDALVPQYVRAPDAVPKHLRP